MDVNSIKRKSALYTQESLFDPMCWIESTDKTKWFDNLGTELYGFFLRSQTEHIFFSNFIIPLAVAPGNPLESSGKAPSTYLV